MVLRMQKKLTGSISHYMAIPMMTLQILQKSENLDISRTKDI